ncbi:MAG: carboxypeptidase regulatory-like domain-containing protein, partial [Actinobacteria bacterium]
APERLLIWQFHADFATPANSTFTGPVEVLVAPFVTPVCGSSRDQCVPQLDSPELLETLSQATMFRLAYRNFGDHESLVTNHTVDAGGEIAGIRWYEIRNPGGTALGNGGATPPLIHQQGTFAPDSNYRWMGSIAQDANGNMALGYSISSESMYPSIAITGRLEGDPLGEMGAEDIFLAGTGSQIDTVSRWGDYSSMSVDPLDDCTFWYTQQYYQETGNFDWNTRVASFKYPGCLAPGTGTISGTVTDGTNPIAGAKVTAGSGAATTDASGQYSITLPIGTYDMTASKYGYFPASADDVEVTDGGNTIQDFELSVAPSIEVNGTVKDGSGGGWPLYANIKITGPGAPTFNIQTDPVTGYYSIVLVQGLTYTFEITSVGPGYLPGGGLVDLPAPPLNAPGLVRNWTLLVDAGVCNAPGYTLNVEGLNEGFEGGGLPAGWEITNETGNDTWYINIGPDPDCGDFAGNLTGGTGYYAVVNSDCAGFASLDTSLVTSSVDMSSLSAAQIRFNSDYRHYDVDVADVDISVDGGTSWTNVWQQTADARGPRVESIDITSLAAGEADVKARFHYYDAFFAWWWQIDNVILGNATCDVGSGGLVIGKVTSLETGQGLNGATVKNLP